MVGSEDQGGRILLGRIVAAHGVRGEVLIRSFAAAPEAIGDYGPLTAPALGRSISLRVLRTTTKGVVARVAGIADRNEAEKLAGTDLYVARTQLPQTGEEEFYHADLVGLEALSPEGTILGRVISVQNFGAGDLLEIALGDSRRTEFVPFTAHYVPQIDLSGGRVTVVLPEASELDEAPSNTPA